ncbi:hypothetical protein LT679_09420 [Mucilaginibacter roseus]|uniref:Uncharacterized protein n=1 Tax=Mucilaginibacter roseus TaxID=1528868 RepID=A0ABS8U127_9SPHI|nr:hypothetical protein [Mucilaginibacter roseus]MCD8740818.1 hypothetical protein [Mucilaginibacter roseus]
MHNFHIPVLGLAFSIDTPLKVARYGISSVVSIVDDELVERMREFHIREHNDEYIPIKKNEHDYRARRITAYLDMLNTYVARQMTALKQQPFGEGHDIDRYFDMLPDGSALKQKYLLMQQTTDVDLKHKLEQQLRSEMQSGSIDVNIMAKVDKMNYDKDGHSTGEVNTDALAALRGFAQSDLNASVILSAGMNPRLYSYLEEFRDFFPDVDGNTRKRVILKVSDYRSALIQAKFLAKKGIWVHEFRIESGLNCGGHAFATDGLLLGPILQGFNEKRQEMVDELQAIYLPALSSKGYSVINNPSIRISVQGGIGTAAENNFLLEHYALDATGWGSPFLLVPEATNVDDETLHQLTAAKPDDFYVSAASPLGVLFNNFKPASIQQLRLKRIAAHRPGSPCTKKYLCTNTEFTAEPICTASRQYQHLKIEQLMAANLPGDELYRQVQEVTEKICLCEGLAVSAYIKNNLLKPRENKAVAICPGPNLAYFKATYSLDEMVKHIYGKLNLLKNVSRPNLFINELNLYLEYLNKEVARSVNNMNTKKEKYLDKFRQQLQQGIDYYKALIPQISNQTLEYLQEMQTMLQTCEAQLNAIA